MTILGIKLVFRRKTKASVNEVNTSVLGFNQNLTPPKFLEGWKDGRNG